MSTPRLHVLLVSAVEHQSKWTGHKDSLRRAGIQLDFVQANSTPAEVAERAKQDDTVVVVELSDDPVRGMETVSTCRKLAEQSPVVVVTDDSSVELARRIRRAGVFYLAVPPVSPEELHNILHDAFNYLRQKRSSASTCKTKRKILIIDDDRDFLTATGALLEAEGYSISSATNGKEGLNKIDSEQPDLVILDIMMEHLSAGYEVNQAIKFKSEHKSVSNIPILMVSSIPLDPAKRFCGAGELEMITPDGYLTKPLDIPEFLARIRKLFGDAPDGKEPRGG